MKITRMLSIKRCNEETPPPCDCPAVFITDSGDVAFIGANASSELKASIPPGAGIGEDEAMVVVPREVLIEAGWVHIPQASEAALSVAS